MAGQLTGTLSLADGFSFEIGGADTQERVDRAGGSSRIRIGVCWVGGLADLLGSLAWRGVVGGVRTAGRPS